MRHIPLRRSISVLVVASLTSHAPAADVVGRSTAMIAALPNHLPPFQRTITGRAAVVDGQTLWFPKFALGVRLADIDACQLPQWSFDPRQHGARKILKPVPCGGLAKAWLKRAIGGATVTCQLSAVVDQALAGRCRTKGLDLAKEMLRVGWARARGSAPPAYVAAQEFAIAARYGMWGTYVLDMDEWRGKAIDRTLGRAPFADFNLLAERQSEISPPFQDFRQVPDRTDR